jgi:hypothetical protein
LNEPDGTVVWSPAVEQSGSGFYAGFSLVFAKPYYKESFEATTISLATGTMDLVPFSQDFNATPRIWAGYVGPNGLGVRATYWQFSHDGNPLTITPDPFSVAAAQVVSVIFPATIIAGGQGQVLQTTSNLRLDTFDLEGTQQFSLGMMSMVASGGIRYALLEQKSEAMVLDGGRPQQVLSWSRRFEGIGPTIGLDIRRPVGDWGFALVGGGRGALLFGHKNIDRFLMSGSESELPFLRLTGADEVVGCGQLELGVEWERQLEHGGFLFVRGTWEGQLWTDAGAPTLTFLGFQGIGLSCGLGY